VILIMTTNAGARDLAARKMGFFDQAGGTKNTGVLERVFAPEFRNRLDAIVHFNPLGTGEIERVVDKHIDELRELVVGRRITVELTPAARTWLATKGFDKAFGARPMARLIEKSIKKPLSDLLLFEGVIDGDRVIVDLVGDALEVRKD
jgi:ATP-dependent Clp protease ATP-binding subunit ClpA